MPFKQMSLCVDDQGNEPLTFFVNHMRTCFLKTIEVGEI